MTDAAGEREGRPGSVMVRPMTPADLDAVCELEQRCFPSPWSRESIERHAFRNPATCYLVAELAGAVIGYAGAWVAADEAHIMTLAVAEGLRGRGIGSALLARLLLEAKRRGATSATLEYRQANEAAVRLYARFGFQAVAVRRGYYRDTGEDAIVGVLRGLDRPEFDQFLEAFASPRVVNNTA